MASGVPHDALFSNAREKLLPISKRIRRGEYNSKGQNSISQATQKMNKLQNRDDLSLVERNQTFREILHNLSQAHELLQKDGFASAANKVGEAMVDVAERGLQMEDLSVDKRECKEKLPEGHDLHFIYS